MMPRVLVPDLCGKINLLLSRLSVLLVFNSLSSVYPMSHDTSLTWHWIHRRSASCHNQVKLRAVYCTCDIAHCSFFLDRHVVYLYVSCLANSTFSLVLTLTYLVLAWKGEKARLKNCCHLSPMRTHVYPWPQKTKKSSKTKCHVLVLRLILIPTWYLTWYHQAYQVWVWISTIRIYPGIRFP